MLVIGHSNTVPDLVMRLGVPPITPIAATVFDRLLVLANRRLGRLRYGQDGLLAIAAEGTVMDGECPQPGKVPILVPSGSCVVLVGRGGVTLP